METLTYPSTSATLEPSATVRWPLWTAILVVGGVFFFVGHDLFVSRFEDFAPWSDDGVRASGGNVAKGLSLALIAGMGLWMLNRPDGRRLGMYGLLPVLVLLYLAWAAASLAWSIDPSMTVRRLGATAFCFLGALGIARQLSPRQLAVMALAITGTYLAVGVAVELALGTFRPWAGGYRFGGTVHPNTQGAYLAILCLSAFVLARSTSKQREQTILIVVLVVAFLFLLLTRSRTALGGMIVGTGAVWFVHSPPRTRVLAVTTGICALCSVALLVSLAGHDPGERLLGAAALGRQEQSGLLTGRIAVWSELARYVSQRPLTGYGYESFWTVGHIEQLSERLQWRFREAHSGYIDACLSVGLVGASILLLGVVLAVGRALGAYLVTRDPGYGLTFGLLCFALVSALMESGVVGMNFITLIIGCGIVQLAFLPREGESQADAQFLERPSTDQRS